MEYSIITVIAVTLTTILVYRLANNVFHLNLRWKPLLLCATCALFMSLVIPRFVVTMAGLAGTIGVLAVFAIIFAYFVACFDENDMEEEVGSSSLGSEITTENEPSSFLMLQFPSETKDELPLQQDLDPMLPPLALSQQQNSTQSEVKVEVEISEEMAQVKEPEEEEDPEILGEQMMPSDFSMVVAFANVDLAISEVIEKQEVTEEKYLEPEEGLLEPAESIEEASSLLSDKAEAEQASLVIPASAYTEPTEETKTFIEQEAPGFLATQVEAVATIQPMESPVESEEAMNSLVETVMEEETVKEKAFTMSDLHILPEAFDDLLDMAFNLLDEGSPSKAVAVFRHALKLYPDSEAAPFIATQIGSILKSSGAYDDAIQVLTEARSLPAFHRDATLDEEFVNSVALLRITKNILLDHRMGLMPYERIPDEIRKEIDTEFHEWRNLV